MQIKALEYSERDQLFHYNTDTHKQPENTNTYKTIVNNISLDKAEKFTYFVYSKNKDYTVAEIKSLFNNNQNI